MAFDGSTVNCIKRELTKELTGARLNKIAQPEPDELLLTFKTAGGLRRLLISANASLPLIYLTDKNKPGPATAPNFCMLLRKHIQNGRLINISQPSLERILIFEIEHMDEMGDLKRKKMIVELMGKHSNIIFTDEDGIIIDSIKHVNSAVSSVREVLPGRDYFIPNTLNKLDPFAVTEDELYAALREKAMPTGRAIYSVLTGFSPVISEELCYRAGADPAIPPSDL